MNPRLKFSERWDKLDDPEFTTIRSWNPSKEAYYISQIGKEFTVGLSEYRGGTGWIFHKVCYAYLYSVDVVLPKELPYSLIEKDTSLMGESRKDWLEKITKMQRALLLRFSKSAIHVQGKLEI